MSEIRQVGYRSLSKGECEMTLEIDGIRATCWGRTVEDARAECIAQLALGPDAPQIEDVGEDSGR